MPVGDTGQSHFLYLAKKRQMKLSIKVMVGYGTVGSGGVGSGGVGSGKVGIQNKEGKRNRYVKTGKGGDSELGI